MSELAESAPDTHAAAAVVQPDAGPGAQSVLRFALAPARYAHRDWWPGRLAQALPRLTATELPPATVAPLSALLMQRYQLDAQPDAGLAAPGAPRVVLLAPPYFECVVNLLGVLACRTALMKRVDAATYRAVLRAVPGVDLAEFFARIDDDPVLAGFAAPLPLSQPAGLDTAWEQNVAKVGARLLLALAQGWGGAVRDRVVLRLSRRAVGASVQTVALDASTRGKLERQLLACLDALEDPQWL